MLVITRKIGQKLYITVPGYEQEIVVELVSRRGDSVRVGVDAPQEFRIFREELIKGKQDGEKV